MNYYPSESNGFSQNILLISFIPITDILNATRSLFVHCYYIKFYNMVILPSTGITQLTLILTQKSNVRK